ncbi:hypothetical protein EW093_01360 [Thiospirochaeta perfilievii]|uniref:Fibronectin type-III domain-containing protein n=1 Tax=Thiospirochaeta perfilievii TaxID=252967 RepID=A0A5C1Q9T4_9SPIO|nr:fibronectin type III domain-containing protein [Thiospirochaeta perfilievii]QEN03404.1 hypothetical protein EW093_01360 [Thiospirochaeta perfilievii]
MKLIKKIALLTLTTVLLLNCSNMLMDLEEIDGTATEILSSGDVLTLPLTNGTTPETIAVKALDQDNDGGIDGFDLDNDGIIDILLFEPSSQGIYPADINGDGTIDCYVLLDNGNVVFSSTSTGTTSDLWLFKNSSNLITGIVSSGTSSTLTSSLPSKTDSVLLGGEIITIPVAGSTTNKVFAQVIDIDGVAPIDGIDLDGDTTTIELTLGTPTGGFYPADANGDGTIDFYITVNNGDIIITKASDGTTTDISVLLDGTTKKPTSWDTTGNSTGDIIIPKSNDGVLTPGEVVKLPTTNGATTGTTYAKALDLDKDGKVDVFDINGDGAGDIPCGLPTGGYYPSDPNSDEVVDFYVYVPTNGDIILTKTNTGTTNNVTVVVDNTGGLVGFDTTGDGTSDITNPTSTDTTAPANPTLGTITAGDTSITINWSEPTDADFASIEYSGTGITTGTVAKGTTTKEITGLTNGTAYTITIKSVDTTGNKSTGVSYASTTPVAPVTFGSATQVIGQADFTSAISGTSSSLMHYPIGLEVIDDKLFIADMNNHRVLGFNSIPTTNGATADFVLGQADLNSRVNGTNATSFYSPYAVSSNSSKLATVDWGNCRVLIWDSIPDTTQKPADVVVGQSNMTSSVSGTASNLMKFPKDVYLTNDKLLVADSGNNRVLIWNSIPTTDGIDADIVLGQPDFTSSDPYTTSSTMNDPISVWSNGIKVIVSDRNNHRLLIWNTFPTSNGQAADVVIGQENFVTNGSDTTASTFKYPLGISVSDSGKLYVADGNNNRILMFNSIPTVNGASADDVIGQTDFSSSNYGTTSSKFYDPRDVVVNNGIWVADMQNNRILRFDE